MKRSDPDTWLDDLLAGSVKQSTSTFDFDRWKLDHEEEIRRFKEQTKNSQAALRRGLNIRSLVMRIGITRIAASAALIAIVVVLGGVLATKSNTAYGLEQTTLANQGLRSVHVKTIEYNPAATDTVENQQELWAEFDESGGLSRMRIEEGLADSARVLVWEKDTVKLLRKATAEYRVQHAPDAAQEMQRAVALLDPRSAAEAMQEGVAKGKLGIAVDESRKDAVQLTVERTGSPEGMPAGWSAPRNVVLVDPQTNLLKQRDEYVENNGEFRLHMRFQYLGYNETIDPAMFALAPPDGAKVDDRTVGVGMPQGNLTDAEAAVEVVRQYIQSKIAADYATAGRLYNGKPAEELRDRDQNVLKIRYVRLILVGPATPSPHDGPRGYAVPFAFELETSDGKRVITGPPGDADPAQVDESKLDPKTLRDVRVRPVPGQPDRWVIIGGI